ncbi:hypothetical protein [Sphingomonas sp. PSPC2-2]|uniref:hypothetical protein n=1 Tax=Sphingomonas sp. PSPC2-2 TaxID=2804576 RepID=UPI003CFB2720
MLNFSSMHRASTSFDKVGGEIRRVFLDVENAVEALFPQDDQIGGSETSDLRWARHWNLRDNIDRWSNAAERIAIANVSMFGKEADLEPSDEEIARYFESDDLALAVYKTVHRTISGIEEDHARHIAIQSFDRLVEMLQNGGIGRERRAPLSFPPGLDVLQRVRRRDAQYFRQIQTLDDLLDHLGRVNGTASPVAKRISEALREDWKEPSTQLLAAVIYMVMGSWELAISCAQICIRTATRKDPRSEVAREARYCKAVCLRMQLRSEREIAIARDELNANLAYRHRDSLILERDSIERATLILSACIVQMVDQFSIVASTRKSRRRKPLVPEDDVKSAFDSQTQELDASLEVLINNYLSSGEVQPLVAAIAGQAAINRLGAELFRHYFEEEVSDSPPRLAEVFDRVSDVLGDIRESYQLPLMGRIYEGVAKVELGRGGDAQSVIDEIDRRHEITKLARGDDHEYDYLRAQMASHASAENRAA